jgi:phospholipid-translocating ATPase
MGDGVYQSLICFFMPYLLFASSTFETSSGLNINDNKRVGVYTASAAIVVVNVYILLNTYRWDWLMLLVAISILLIWFWTGVYTASSSSDQFYRAAPQVYGQLSFWVLTLLTVCICLLPRFTVKAFQKIYFPLDVDIVREQVRQGKFKYLDNYEAYIPPGKLPVGSSSDISQPANGALAGTQAPLEDDERPIYPPSVAATGTTHNPRSQTGSNGTDHMRYKTSLEMPRPSFDRPRPSFDRVRSSMDQIRPSFEASNDFTSANLLMRMESSHSDVRAQSRTRHGQSSLR